MNKESYVRLIKYLLYVIVFLWIVHIASYFFPINRYGIIPREAAGLAGIFLAPFLHHDFPHLAANSAALFGLGMFLIASENRRALFIVIFLILLTGTGTWLIGRSDTVHIGSSGIIYGMLGYLIAKGLFERDFKSILISITVFFLYCGMIFGILSMDPTTSWESHICGFMSGIIIASVTAKIMR